MSGNMNEIDFDGGGLALASDLLFAPEVPRDARRMVEDRLEEVRLRKELMDYEYDF